MDLQIVVLREISQIQLNLVFAFFFLSIYELYANTIIYTHMYGLS